MDEKMRLNLKKMINEYNPEQTTDKIRTLKHSQKIREDVGKMILFQKKYSRLEKSKQYKMLAQKHCTFLYNNYTNIFNRLLKKELNMQILDKFLVILKQIEDGNIDQHEGSYMVGNLLKELYIDSALRQDKGDKKSIKIRKPVNNVSWKEWKQEFSKSI